jgi:hypothetical protein
VKALTRSAMQFQSKISYPFKLPSSAAVRSIYCFLAGVFTTLEESLSKMVVIAVSKNSRYCHHRWQLQFEKMGIFLSKLCR